MLYVSEVQDGFWILAFIGMLRPGESDDLIGNIWRRFVGWVGLGMWRRGAEHSRSGGQDVTILGILGDGNGEIDPSLYDTVVGCPALKVRLE